jgi:hypothetical protein
MCSTSIVILAFLAQLSPPSTDPQAKAEAQSLLTEGSGRYEKGDYAGALEKFNAAYAAYPSPKLMFNIGQANRDLSRPVEALEAFEKFLAGDLDASPETTADARKSLAELRNSLGRIRIDCETDGAEVSVDGKSVGRTPLPQPIWSTPGHHQVTASHALTALALENVEVTAGSVQNVTLRLHALAIPVDTPPSAQPAVAPTPPAEPDMQDGQRPVAGREGWWLGRRWTWVAAGSTVLLAAGAITAGLSMQSKYDSLNASCGSTSATRPGCTDGDIASVSTRRNLANVFWGLAGAAAVTTGVLFYFEGRPISAMPVAGEMTGALARVGF